MNTIHQGVITLLKSAITGEKERLPENFDLGEAVLMCKKHYMDALLYQGAVNCGLNRDDPAMKTLFQAYCKGMLVSERQMKAYQRLCAAFENHGIDYLPLKGCKMKALYPKPELRTMGDADILIRQEQYEQIIPIMQKLGYEMGEEGGHHDEWSSPALNVELHRYLLPADNHDYFAVFGDGWKYAIIKEETRYKMSPEDEFVFLFLHFARHFRSAGIGCRHVLDLWVYLRAHPQLDDSAVTARLKELGLTDFYRNISGLLGVWFENKPVDEMSDFLTGVIFANGSWGTKANRVVSMGVQETKNSPLLMGGKLNYLRRNLFLPLENMQKLYPVLSKAPLLLPLMWLIRCVQKLFCMRRMWRKHKGNLAALTPQNISDRRSMLEYVGLEFH